MTTDAEKEFNSHLSTICNSTMVGHGLMLGKKTGLLKIMLELNEPKTSQEIADIGNFKERYVREWLNLMVCGRIFDYEKSTKKYHLPDYKKAALNPGAKNNMAMFGTVLSFVQVQPHLLNCFKEDGPRGIPMSTYEGFQFHHHSHESHTISIDKLKEVLAKIPGLLPQLENGAEIFEAGCSSGILSRRLAEAFPKSNVFGVDISDEGIEKAKQLTSEKQLKNVSFDVADLSDIPDEWSGKYDIAYSHFVIHDVPKASVALKEILKILKPGGVYLMIDFNMHTDVADNLSHPIAGLTYAAGLYFAVPLSLSEEGGEGLGPTWGIESMEEYLKHAGFERVHQPYEPEDRNAFIVGFKPK